MSTEIEQIVIDTTRQILADEGLDADVSLDADTTLFGPNGLLDSMGLVALVVAIEQQLQDRFGKAIALADEKALSQKNSPYRSVRTLARYATQELASVGSRS